MIDAKNGSKNHKVKELVISFKSLRELLDS